MAQEFRREVNKLEANLQIIRVNLREFFKLLSERALELYFKDIELEELGKIHLDGYMVDSIWKSMMRLKEGVSLFVSFFSNYVKSCIIWYDLFCELVRALNYEDFNSVLFKKVKLDDVIIPSKIDINYFRFQVRASLDLYLPDMRNSFLSTYLKAKDLPKIVHYTSSEFAKKLILVMEEQDEDWRKLLNEIYSFYENSLLKENLQELIRGLVRIIGFFIELAERLKIVKEFIIPHKSWEELMITDIKKLGVRVEELKEEIIMIADYRMKYYEHGVNSALFLLRMLWGNEEVALKRLEDWARAKLSSDELIPKDLRFEDLAFALIGAREEFNLLGQAIEVLKEKINILDEAAKILGSKTLKNLYEEIKETIKGHDSFWQETYDKLLTIQDLTIKTLDKK
ncbi:MAG: hypothetical protein QW279_08850 [Candidatus Jordarchaeaceae archaeon]